MTNTDAMKGLIDLVLGVLGFISKIIITENHQHTPNDSRGWKTGKRNGRFNQNDWSNITDTGDMPT